MHSRSASVGALMLAALAWTATAASQAPAGPPSRIARLGAVVTVGGAPVAGLTAADFTLVEDGVPRSIETASPRTGPRVFAFLLDEFHVSPGPPADEVRAALERFVRGALAPGDRIAILKPMDSLTGIHFIENPEEALAVIEDFEGRLGDLTPRSAAEARLLGTSPPLVRAGRATIVASALRALTAQVGRMEARGAVALVSAGFAEPGRRARQPMSDMQAVSRVAVGLDVPVYCFAPLEPTPPPVGAGFSRPDTDREEAEAGKREALRMLAEQTGGRASFERNRLDADLARMAADLDASYQLTYRDAGPFDAKYHGLELGVTRPDVEVLARSGHWAPVGDPAAQVATGRTPSVPVLSWRSRPVHRSPFAETWVGLSRGSEGRMRVVVTWEPDRGPVWSRGGARASLGRFRATRPDKTIVFEGRIAPAFDGQSGEPRAAIFEASPGPLELDLTLVDENGRVLDVDSRDVQVPDPDEARPRLMDPEVMRARTAVEFRELAADPDAAPTPARDFRRTERLIVRAPAYDAGGAPLRVRARLLNPLGQPMLELEPMPAATRNGITQFDLPLAPYAPGTYEIELSATSPSGEVRMRVRFELTG